MTRPSSRFARSWVRRTPWQIALLVVAPLVTGPAAAAERDESPPAPQPTESGQADGSSEADVEKLRAILGELGAEGRDRRRWMGFASLAAGGLALGSGTYFLTRGGSRFDYTRQAGGLLVVNGLFSIGVGAILFASSGGTYETLARDLERRAGTGPASAAVTALETRWASAAATARSERKAIGWFALVLGTVGVAAGLVQPAIVPPREQDRATPIISFQLAMLGIGLLTTGVDQLLFPSDVEQTWRTYKAMKARTPSAPQASLRPRLTPTIARNAVDVTLGVVF